MKVIFVKDVPKVAKKNDIKEQPDGYVRNFLLPKGFAIIATPEAIQKLERTQNGIRVEKEIKADLFKKNIRAVNGVGLNLKVKANEQGSLFKAIHAKDIAEALRTEHKIMIDEAFVNLDQPIKHVGEFPVTIEALGMKESITVNVVAT